MTWAKSREGGGMMEEGKNGSLPTPSAPCPLNRLPCRVFYATDLRPQMHHDPDLTTGRN